MSSNNINDAFASPKSEVENSATGGDSALTEGIIHQLKRTRPWVLFLSILGFFFTALMAIATIGLFFGENSNEFAFLNDGSTPVIAGTMYFLFTLIYFFLSYYLFKYAGSIKKVVSNRKPDALEKALSSQASFWKLIGISSIIFTIMMLVAMLGAITPLISLLLEKTA